MYMSIYNGKDKILEVDIYTDTCRQPDTWAIQVHTWFNIKNLLKSYDDLLNSKDFALDMSIIQSWTQAYYENKDIEFPKYDTYDFETKYQEMNKDKNKLISIIRERLLGITKRYNLSYTED